MYLHGPFGIGALNRGTLGGAELVVGGSGSAEIAQARRRPLFPEGTSIARQGLHLWLKLAAVRAVDNTWASITL